MNIDGVVTALQGHTAALTGMKHAPVDVPESVNQFPFSVTYLRQGEMKHYSAGFAEILIDLYTEIHIGRTLLASAITTSHELIKDLMERLRDDPTLGNAVDTIVSIRLEFGQLAWGGVTTIGTRVVTTVKMQV